MGESRTWSRAFIVLVLGYHVGMPLTYYLSDRVYDERFSWRMFSTVRLQECDIVVTETVMHGDAAVDVPTPVTKDVQTAWISILKRMRPAVIEKYLAHRCDSASATHAKFVGRCRNTDGTLLPERRYTLACGDRALSFSVAP
jgi:hypothetical protein